MWNGLSVGCSASWRLQQGGVVCRVMENISPAQLVLESRDVKADQPPLLHVAQLRGFANIDKEKASLSLHASGHVAREAGNRDRGNMYALL